MDKVNLIGKPISGSTTINHEVRQKLELTNDEYVLLSFLNTAQQEKRDITYELVYRKTAIEKADYDIISNKLFVRDYIRASKVEERVFIKVSKRFREAFYVQERDFDEFWFNAKTGVCDWPGSKSDALAKYIICRKSYPHDYLMKQKNWYFRFLELPDNSFRKKLGASVFLNMSTKRFEEDFEAHWRASTGVALKQQPVQPLSKAQKEGLFI